MYGRKHKRQQTDAISLILKHFRRPSLSFFSKL